MKVNVKQRLEEELEKHFILEKEDWVNVNLFNVNRIDVDIVTSISETNKDSNIFVEEIIKKVNKDLKLSEKLYVGFCNIYSVEEAEFLDIEKPKIKSKKEVSFGAIIDNKENNLNYKKQANDSRAKIIAFYSYKGGVGRTVALIQTARLLAEKGKKVALIDMDLEAPSFNEIFRSDIKIDNGLVKYLYNKLYNSDKELTKDERTAVTSITSKLSLTSSGDVYIIGAGRVDEKYVKMLEALKQKRIIENEYIEELVKSLTEIYDVEYVLIDSRTGINNWGALSIGAIADEVMLFAYPNIENVEGINLILDMLGSQKKVNVIFSRIDATEAGIEKAEKLFKEVNVKQNFIGIQYDSAIAVTSKYPIENKLDKFLCIRDLILEDENDRTNRRWIKEHKEDINYILDNLSSGKDFDKIFTNDELKALNLSNYFIIVKENIELKEILKRDNNNIGDFNFYYNEIEKIVNRAHKSYNMIDMIGICISVLALVNIDISIGKDSNKSVEELISNYFYDLSKIHSLNESNIDGMFKRYIDILSEKNKQNNSVSFFCIDNNQIKKFSKLFFDKYYRVSDNRLMYQVIFLWISFLNRINQFQFKLVLESEEYNKNREIFEEVKANLLDLCWSDLEDGALLETLQKVFKEAIIHSKMLKQISFQNLVGESIEEKILFPSYILEDDVKNNFTEWFVKEIRKNNILNKKDVLNIVKISAKLEKENSFEDKVSIIDIKKVKKAIEIVAREKN